MASGGSLIGALKVSLGIDSAAFEFGLKKAQSGLGKFGKTAGVSFAAVAAAGVAAASAMGVLVLRAANSADALSKTSQKIGVTTEALSRLKYAADFSDVSLEQLSGGLGKLSKNMLDVATGSKGPASTAFAALGISVKDADGKLKSADQTFAEIADKLSRMEDGTVKTALAQRLFGKTGAELIPLLNEGAAGLKRFADESDRTGNTISTKTGKAAEKFNDTLAKVGKGLEGVANKVMDAALPALQGLADTITSPKFGEAVAGFGTLIVGMANGIAQAITGAWAAAKDFLAWLNAQNPSGMSADKRVSEIQKQRALLGKMQTPGNGSGWFGADAGPDDIARVEARIAELEAAQTAAQQTLVTPQGPGGRGGRRGTGAAAPEDTVVDLDLLSTSATKALEVIDPLAARVGELSDVLTMTQDPFEQMKLDLTDLKTIFDESRISAETYGQAVAKTMLNTASSTLGSLSQISGALAGAFQDNKYLAAANAAINTAQGITKALAEGGPFGFPIAAAIGVAGAAQIAAILSTQPGGASSAPSVPSAAPAEPTGGRSGNVANVEFRGQPGDVFSRDQGIAMAKTLIGLQRDGYELVLKGA